MLESFKTFLNSDGRYAGTDLVSQQRMAVEAGTLGGAVCFSLAVGKAKWQGTVVRKGRPTASWTQWKTAELWLLDRQQDRMLQHQARPLDGKVVFEARTDYGYEQRLTWEMHDPGMAWSFHSSSPDGSLTLRWKGLLTRERSQYSSFDPVDALSVEVGPGLSHLVATETGAPLLARVTAIRRHIALELGLIVPGIRFRDNLTLKPEHYAIKIHDVTVARGEVRANQLLAMAPEEKIKRLSGYKTVDPTYGMPCVWIAAGLKPEAEQMGCMIFDEVLVMATQLTEVIRNHAASLLGWEEVRGLVDAIAHTHPVLVKELRPACLSTGRIQGVLQHLLRERVAIRDLPLILETVIHHAEHTKDIETLGEFVRRALSPAICAEYTSREGAISVITVDPAVESLIADHRQNTPHGFFLTLDGDVGTTLLDRIGQEVSRVRERGVQPILLTAPAVRYPLRVFTQRTFPDVVVLSWNEITDKTNVNPIGNVTLKHDHA